MPPTDHNQKIIDIKLRRLRKLKEQEATFGPHTPAHISTEIDTITDELTAWGVDLSEFAPQPPPPEQSSNPQPGSRGDSTTAPQPAADISRYYALLVGVRDYAAANYRSLPHTIPDIVELDKVLRAAGYTIRLLHSDLPNDPPTRSNIWGEFETLTQQTGPGDLLLVYFGGHGDLDDNGNAYLIPSDLRSRAALSRTGINLAEFTATLARAGAQARLLLLDACHSGIGRSGGAMTPEFEKLTFFQATGTATMAACRRGEVAYDHNGSNHGAFTYYLLEGLRGAAQNANGLITFSALSNYVTASVKQWAINAGLQQWPNAAAALVGDPPLLRVTTAPNTPTRDGANRPPNPFTATLAVNCAEAFMGRQTELARLLALLPGGSVSLTGDPKIGKSSLLLALARSWPGLVIGPIDCHALEDRDDFYKTLATLLGLSGADWRLDLRPAMQQIEALLLLDEFDTAPDIGLTPQDLGRFRAVCSQNRKLHLVTAARQPLRQVFPDNGRGSPVFNFLPPLTLGPLTEAEARHLLAHPWAAAPDFDPATQTELITLTGAHPFKLQRAAYNRYESWSDPTYDWQAAYQQDVEYLL